jgi:hypothetical protein
MKVLWYFDLLPDMTAYLIAETNAENRTVHFERSAQIGDRGCATSGVAGTIAEKETW